MESAWRLMPDLQVGIVPIRRPDQLGLLVSAVQRFPVTRVGVSPAFNDLIGTPFALHCARVAMIGAQLRREPITVFDESALAVGAVASPDIMQRVSETVLAGLYELPSEERELLLDTLETWFDKGGSAGRAAEVLFCHPNTVRYRLRRIEERTGRSLTDPRQTAELCVALETARRLPRSP
jgi:sugar diacid utilization regulator